MYTVWYKFCPCLCQPQISSSAPQTHDCCRKFCDSDQALREAKMEVTASATRQNGKMEKAETWKQTHLSGSLLLGKTSGLASRAILKDL